MNWQCLTGALANVRPLLAGPLLDDLQIRAVGQELIQRDKVVRSDDQVDIAVKTRPNLNQQLLVSPAEDPHIQPGATQVRDGLGQECPVVDDE